MENLKKGSYFIKKDQIWKKFAIIVKGRMKIKLNEIKNEDDENEEFNHKDYYKNNIISNNNNQLSEMHQGLKVLSNYKISIYRNNSISNNNSVKNNNNNSNFLDKENSVQENAFDLASRKICKNNNKYKFFLFCSFL